MNREELVSIAVETMKKSYSPYSGCKVGAALLSADGKVYIGCNVENAAFSPTICAERSAFAAAIADGSRSFTAIAVAGGKNGAVGTPFVPCGVCRQVMREFCDNTFSIYVATAGGEILDYTLLGLLPNSFGNGHLR